MSQPASSTTSARIIRLDWMLVAVTLMAVLLLVATTVRTHRTPDAGSPRQIGGLQLLGADDRLIAFDDFAVTAAGWQPDRRSAEVTALGSQLGPFTDAPAMRQLTIPPGTVTTISAFTLHLDGEVPRGATLRLRLGDTTATLDLPTGGDDTATTGAFSVRALTPLTPDTSRFAVRLTAMPDAGEVPLEVQVIGGAGRAWFIDNVQVIGTLARLGAGG